MAMTAWSANVSSRAISRSLYATGDAAYEGQEADGLALMQERN